MIENITNWFVGAVLAVSSLLGIYNEPVVVEPVQETLGATVNPAAGATYTLSGGGVSSSATSITLSSLTLPQNGYPIQDSDLSATFYITLEPGNRSRQEIVSCTTVTQNAAGTATLSGCTRGLSPITPYTASSSLQFSHGGGSQVIFSDPPQLFNQYPAKANDETITGQWTFSTFPVTPSNSAASETVAGVAELATGAEAAATTLSGGVGRLALSTAISTSTYNSATAANVVPVTNSLGHIDAGFVSSSTQFSVTATTTLSATSSVLIGAFPAWQIGKQIQVFSSPGTTTFSVPSGITRVKVTTVGAGGAGGSVAPGGTSESGGGGGGAGACAIEWIDVSGTSTIQVFVGTGGTGVVGAAGNPGTWSTFGTNGFYNSAGPGLGGGFDTAPAGGAGGTATGGTLNIAGGGGGGGSLVLAAGVSPSGAGGNSCMGGGGRGLDMSSGTTGIAGGDYGGGGGGAPGVNGAANTGGAGANGAVLVEW